MDPVAYRKALVSTTILAFWLTITTYLSGCIPSGVCPTFPVPSDKVVTVLEPIMLGDKETRLWLDQFSKKPTDLTDAYYPEETIVEKIKPTAYGEPEVLLWFNELYRLQQKLDTCKP